MIVDTSALVAIARHETGYESLLQAIVTSSPVQVSAVSALEFGLVLTNKNELDERRSTDLLESWNITVVPFDEAHAKAAIAAHARFGKGRHKAALNFGDCAAYATAMLAKQPLLFVGEDFTHTDVVAVPIMRT